MYSNHSLLGSHLQLNGVSILHEEMHSTCMLPVNTTVQLSAAATMQV